MADASSQSYGALVWARYKRAPLGIAGAILMAVLMALVLLGSFLAPHDPDRRFEPFMPPSSIGFSGDGVGIAARNPVETGLLDPVTAQPIISIAGTSAVPLGFLVRGDKHRLFGLVPTDRHFLGPKSSASAVHFLGTDRFGRDILSRAIMGARISLLLALTVVTITTSLGLLLGLTAGYLGGAFDRWSQRLVDFVLAFPQLPLYLALGALIPVTISSGGFLLIMVGVMSVLGWAGLSREVRSKTLSFAQTDYVRAAIALGASPWRVIGRHIAPNLLSHVVVSFTLTLPAIVLLESFLGFLGLAVKPPLISWGLMLQDAGNFAAIGSYPWILSPVIFVFITVFALNSVGDALRDAIDPY